MENFKKELKELLTKYNTSLNVWNEDNEDEVYNFDITTFLNDL